MLISDLLLTIKSNVFFLKKSFWDIAKLVSINYKM
jgi:hypothetical protein